MECDFIQDGIPYVIMSDCYYAEKKILKPIPPATPIKLPKKCTFTDEDKVIICVNTNAIEYLVQYNYDHNSPHTSIWLTFALYKGDVITFRIHQPEE